MLSLLSREETVDLLDVNANSFSSISVFLPLFRYSDRKLLFRFAPDTSMKIASKEVSAEATVPQLEVNGWSGLLDAVRH
jgi:hypothetical protein